MTRAMSRLCFCPGDSEPVGVRASIPSMPASSNASSVARMSAPRLRKPREVKSFSQPKKVFS